MNTKMMISLLLIGIIQVITVPSPMNPEISVSNPTDRIQSHNLDSWSISSSDDDDYDNFEYVRRIDRQSTSRSTFHYSLEETNSSPILSQAPPVQEQQEQQDMSMPDIAGPETDFESSSSSLSSDSSIFQMNTRNIFNMQLDIQDSEMFPSSILSKETPFEWTLSPQIYTYPMDAQYTFNNPSYQIGNVFVSSPPFANFVIYLTHKFTGFKSTLYVRKDGKAYHMYRLYLRLQEFGIVNGFLHTYAPIRLGRPLSLVGGGEVVGFETERVPPSNLLWIKIWNDGNLELVFLQRSLRSILKSVVQMHRAGVYHGHLGTSGIFCNNDAECTIMLHPDSRIARNGQEITRREKEEEVGILFERVRESVLARVHVLAGSPLELKLLKSLVETVATPTEALSNRFFFHFPFSAASSLSSQ